MERRGGHIQILQPYEVKLGLSRLDQERRRRYIRSEMVTELGKPGGYVDQELQKDYIRKVDTEWQPSKFVPDLSTDAPDRIAAYQNQIKDVSDASWVVQVGNGITEEGLPLFTTALDSVGPLKDQTGIDNKPWPKWNKWWTGQEKGHGTVIDRSLYLSGKVNMEAYERTVEYFIRNGMAVPNDPIQALIYPAPQERATKIAHVREGILLGAYGARDMLKQSAAISNQEAHHEEFYGGAGDHLVKMNPDQFVLAFEELMQTGFMMPAARMNDVGDLPSNVTQSDIFTRYSTVAQRLGVYTAQDFADIFEHFMDRWNIKDLKGLKGDAAAAQDRLGRRIKIYHKAAERRQYELDRLAKQGQKLPFSWIHGREVDLAHPGIIYDRESKKAVAA